MVTRPWARPVTLAWRGFRFDPQGRRWRWGAWSVTPQALARMPAPYFRRWLAALDREGR